MPTNRSHGAAAEVDGKIYVMGGSPGFGNVSGTTANEAYDPVTNTWQSIASMPQSGIFQNVEAVNGKIYVLGGHSNNVLLDQINVFDPSTNTWTTLTTSMPTPRRSAASAVHGDNIYVLGGSAGGPLDDVSVFDTLTETWSTIESLPLPTSELSAVVLDNILYAIGGVSTNGYTAEVYAYDLSGNQVAVAAPGPAGVLAFSVAMLFAGRRRYNRRIAGTS